MKYIIPECMPHYYRNGVKVSKEVTQSTASTSNGFLLPCCWCDAPSTKSDIENLGLYNPKLKISSNKKISNILLSEQWKKFIDTILHDVSNAPRCCKEKCGVSND